jgi:hypothetical protein
MREWLVALAAITLAGSARLTGQDLVSAAREATARYRDRDSAIADGYRRVGPDFPGMGEHWVNPRLLLDGTLDAARPPVLEYADIAGRPTLVGIAYAALSPGAGAVPAGLPVPPTAWHTHSGGVDEESFILTHAGAHHAHQASDGPGLAIVHAWVWLDNPEGVFATDNWALPCARLGFTPPPGLSSGAGRALALAAGGEAYFARLVRVVGRPEAPEAARLDTLWGRAAAEVAGRVGRGDGHSALRVQDVAWLDGTWRRTWAAVLAAASPPVRARLAALETP